MHQLRVTFYYFCLVLVFNATKDFSVIHFILHQVEQPIWGGGSECNCKTLFFVLAVCTVYPVYICIIQTNLFKFI